MVYLLRYLREILGVFSSSEGAVNEAKRYWDQLPDHMKPDVYGKPNQWYHEFNIIPLSLDESVKPSVLDEDWNL
jgi:hypothetical protein